MNKSSKIKFISILLSLIMAFSSNAEFKVENYFNGLEPQKHINKTYTNERKESLKQNIIKYDDIEDMIHLYNPTILNLWNTWENNKSSLDIYNDYQDAANALSGGGTDVSSAMANAQADAMRIQADKNADDSYTNFLTNYLTEKQLVLSTKILLIEYLQSAYDLITANENLAEAERKRESALNAKNYGSGTQLDYLSSEKNLVDAQSKVVTATSTEKTKKRNLIINCGKSMNDDINITPIEVSPYFDMTTINLNEDYKKALANNIQLEIYRRRKDNAITDEVKNEYKILIDAAPNNIYNDLESKYSTIADCLDTNYNRQVALNLAEDSLKQAKNNIDTGKISQKEYKTAEYNVNVAKANVESAKYDLRIAIENYNAAVDGLSSC